MGEMQVPADALYGASTARAVDNFPVAHEPVPASVIHAFGHLKAACAQANLELGKLDAKLAEAIIAASNDVAAGKYDEHFPVDIYQTGSGTSTNMNANEVIANLANQRLGIGLGAKGAEGRRPSERPREHGAVVERHVPRGDAHRRRRCDSRNGCCRRSTRLADELAKKAKEWDAIVKIGRTHLMDATPIRVGQVFAGYAAQAHYATIRGGRALARLEENMPIGGTAVGTGINTHPEFAKRVCAALSKKLGVNFQEADNHSKPRPRRIRSSPPTAS